MIVMKEATGLRWVTGKYTKGKTITISTILDPGQYYVIIMVDWGNRVYDMRLNYSGTAEVSFERVPQC
jgi:hypothetical protein